MKSEELLNSLDYVGEDLLAAAEQTVQVRRRRPWAGAAAAVLALALGAGGFFLLRGRLGRGQDPAPNQGSEGPVSTVVMSSPGDEDPTAPPPTECPDPQGRITLNLGESYTGEYEERDFPDMESWLAYSAPTLNEVITTLPVYRSRARSQEGDPARYLSRRELEGVARSAAQVYGLTISRLWFCREDGFPVAESEENPPFLQAECDPENATLRVRGDGRIEILYRTALEPEFQYDPADPEAAARGYARQVMGLDEEAWDVTFTNRASSLDTGMLHLYLHLYRPHPLDNLLAYSFERVEMTLTAEGKLRQLTTDGLFHSSKSALDPVELPYGMELLGDYERVPLETAQAMVRQGRYLSDEALDGKIRDDAVFRKAVEDSLDRVEIVYVNHYESNHTILIPYYRFWPQLVYPGEAEYDWGTVGSKVSLYVPIYCPAVTPTDFYQAEDGN